jgi:hypothetical protein
MKREQFRRHDIKSVNNAVAMAEEVVSNFYKMSEGQWLRRRYDVKTLVDLSPDEVVDGPFAQIIRYEGKLKDLSLGSSAYDFYKICLQDHSILPVIRNSPEINLFPFILYIVTHELIHIVRFSKFLQSFVASTAEKMAEEKRVHERTHEILKKLQVSGLPEVLTFYHEWRKHFDEYESSKI